MSKIFQHWFSRDTTTSTARLLHDALARVSTLLTYNGHWGDFTSALSPLLADTTNEILVLSLQQLLALDKLVQLCEVFWKKQWEGRIKHYVFSIERCPATWLQARQDKVHIHVWFQKNARGVGLEPKDVRKLDAAPQLSTLISDWMGTRGVRLVAASWAGALYLQADKSGTLATRGTIQPFVGYPVKDYWITNLFSSEKTMPATAQSLYVRCVKRAVRNIHELEFVVAMWQRAELGADRREVNAERVSSQRPFAILPEVQQWHRQCERSVSRDRFLVLDGPSMTGKTKFALSRSPPPADTMAFYVDCSAGLPDMRRFERHVHQLVVLEESKARTATELKKYSEVPMTSCRSALLRPCNIASK
jgi:hypothetical protein